MSKYCFLLTPGKVRLFKKRNVAPLAHQGWLRKFISLKKGLINSSHNKFAICVITHCVAYTDIFVKPENTLKRSFTFSYYFLALILAPSIPKKSYPHTF